MWFNGIYSVVLLNIVIFVSDLGRVNGGMQPSKMFLDVLREQNRTKVVACPALKLALHSYLVQN